MTRWGGGAGAGLIRQFLYYQMYELMGNRPSITGTVGESYLPGPDAEEEHDDEAEGGLYFNITRPIIINMDR